MPTTRYDDLAVYDRRIGNDASVGSGPEGHVNSKEAFGADVSRASKGSSFLDTLQVTSHLNLV